MNHEIQKPNNIPEQPKKEFEMSYEPFDPKAELKNLRTYDKETRAEKLENYKTELIKQKEGIVEIQVDLERQIRENPDLTQKELMKIAVARAPEFRISENQLKLFEKTLDTYVAKHQAIREARKKYPDDKELFKACFGKEPEGPVEIIEGPMTLYFRCHNLKDYAWIYSRKFLDAAKKQKVTKSDIQRANMSGGALILECLIPSLNSAITVEKSEKGELINSPDAERVFKHEEQHAIYRLFNELDLHEYLYIIDKIFAELFAKEQSQDKIREEFKNKQCPKLLIDYLKSIRSGFENSAKDEILAYFKAHKEGIDNLETTKTELLTPMEEGGLYDYYGKNKKGLNQNLKEKLTPKIFRKNKNVVRKTIEQVLVKEYRQDIIEAIEAIKKLRILEKSRQKVTYLLNKKPLNQWSKLVKRVKEIKT